MTDPGGLYDDIREEVGRVLIGNEDIIEGLTVALLSDGHILLEGVPGIAKTTTAELFARAFGLDHARIQMTPDVLPADITGTKVYREETGEFETRKGPIFANIVLADEINRATPKTQSALLEAMAERNVTIEGDSHALPSPFLLIATQNPIEMEGTFALPEAQRDRFQQKLTMELPDRDDERLLLNRFDDEPSLGPDAVEPVTTPEELLEVRETVGEVYVAPQIKEYALELVGGTRDHDQVEHGASPRATLAFIQAGKARAAIHDREYVIPDDIKALARPVLVHRLVLNTDAEIGGVDAAAIVDEIVEEVESPSGEAATETPPPTGPDTEPESSATDADAAANAGSDDEDDAPETTENKAQYIGTGAAGTPVNAGVDISPGSGPTPNQEADDEFLFEEETAASGDETGEPESSAGPSRSGGSGDAEPAEAEGTEGEEMPNGGTAPPGPEAGTATEAKDSEVAEATGDETPNDEHTGLRSLLPW
jgi:MoxR-like ATPase